jgi:hypothetical protein
MPALNIEFTEEELARVRERARARDLAMATYVHDVLMTCGDRADEDASVMVSAARSMRLSKDLLRMLADS